MTDTCQQKTCSAPATCRFYWPGSGFLKSCADCAQKAVTIGRAMGCLITVHAGAEEHQAPPLPEFCDQEGGVVDPVRGHVPGKCTYLQGHEGRHSWEPFES